MNKHHRITTLILSFILCIGATICTSAAQKDISKLSAQTGLEAIGSYKSNSAFSISGIELPSSYNSKENGFTLPVRIQDSNTCWAFGSLSTFETLLLKDGKADTETFSPQHANYWGIKRDDGTGWQRSFSDPGYSFIPLGYLTSWAGPINDYDFPLTSTQEDYNILNAHPKYGLTEVIYFSNDTERNTIKELIYTYGSVVASFDANSNYMSNDSAFFCADTSISISQHHGHCVSIVGWDDNYSKENFAESKSGTPKNDGAWIMKNSWGSYFGEDGYMWISYEDVWVFDDVFGPSYAFTKYEPICEDVKLYQNETDGATYEFAYLRSPSITYMNAFDFSESDRRLDKIVFESTALGCTYSAYYIPFDGDTPTNDQSLWKKLYDGTIDYTGYICADIEDTLLPEGKGAIGITISKTETSENATIGVCEWLSSGSKMIFIPQTDYGKSYIMDMGASKNVVTDVMELYTEKLSDDVGGTFVIKALTRNECSGHPTEDPTEPPTAIPTEAPTAIPTEPPTAIPTEAPTTAPVVIPTIAPTTAPVVIPTIAPTTAPVVIPTIAPTTAPVVIPTIAPTTAPVVIPTITPTTTPSVLPTVAPTQPPVLPPTDPTETPSTMPTVVPTAVVTHPVTSAPQPTQSSTFDVAEPFVYLSGDCDLSGIVNIRDASHIQKYAAQLISLTKFELLAGDVNKNNDVNVVDATYIQKFVADLQVDVSIGQTCVYFE